MLMFCHAHCMTRSSVLARVLEKRPTISVVRILFGPPPDASLAFKATKDRKLFLKQIQFRTKLLFVHTHRLPEVRNEPTHKN